MKGSTFWKHPMLPREFVISISKAIQSGCGYMMFSFWSSVFASTSPTSNSPLWNELGPLHLNFISTLEIICEYLEVPPSTNVFFSLFTLTRPNGGGLTMGWLSFRAQPNRKVFLLYEKSFHHFKPFYFKVFGALNMISFWETLEGDLRINCYWNKHFKIPRVNEADLSSEEWAMVDYFLTHFGKEHLNLKCRVSVEFEAARTHLGDH